MKNLMSIFKLLLFPFLLLLNFGMYFQKKHWKQSKNLSFLVLFFIFSLPLHAAINFCSQIIDVTQCNASVLNCHWNEAASPKKCLAGSPPSANAGADQTVTVGDTVTLDGSSSSDTDGTIASYLWTEGGTTLSTAVSFDKSDFTEGTHTITLTVTDAQGDVGIDEVVITVTPAFTGGICASPRPYTQAYYANIPGQIDIIGNSVVCQNNGSDICSDPGDTRNNSINMMYINVDSDDTTFNHSSAELNLPEESEIKWVGLYWQGMFAGPNGGNQNDSATIKFKVPGGSYVDVMSDSSKHNWVYLKETQNRWMYQGVADITHLIDLTNPNGYYGVANLHTQTGTPAGGSFGAWSIVIVYYNKNLPIRNLSVYDGYMGIMPGGNGDACSDRTGDPQKACEYAEANGCPITLEATGVANPVSVTLDGFLTPKDGNVDSSFVLFSGEGDRGVSGDQLSITNKSGTVGYVSDTLNSVSDVQNATISKNGIQVTTLEPQATLAGGTPWINTLGADIDFFDVSDKLDNDQSSTVITMNTSGDGYFPGVFAFSTELYQPSLCYDYAYKQGTRYFTEDNDGSFIPRITGDGVITGDPITVEFYLQNTEASDIVLKNLTLDIFDINTTQATYIPNSTYIVKPGEVFPVQHTDTESGPSYNNDIGIGDVDGKDYFYVDYDLNPTTTDIDMPLNVRLNYDVILPFGESETLEINYDTYINSDIPLCSNNNFKYTPAYGIFNVEDSVLSQSNLYNLPTQTANRVGDFVVAAYESASVHTRKEVSTVVAIELIDAGKFHTLDASCLEPDSALGPRIWVTFGNLTDINVSRADFDYATITNAITTGMVSDQILASGSPLSSAEEFFSNARENTAFRIAYNGAGSGDLIDLEPVECTGADKGKGTCWNVNNFTEVIKYNGGNCVQDVDENSANIDKIPQFCNNAGGAAASAMSPEQLSICMECVYGFDVNFLCSRDNFSTRPESFRMSLKDQDQTTQNQPDPSFALNNDDSIRHQIAAGYNYALEINATNHQNDNPTPGYDAEFFIDGNNSTRFFKLDWQTSTDDTKCNDIEDHNKTVEFNDSGRTDLNLSSAQVGNYDLTLFDKLWTRVDWDPTLMTHHTTGQGVGYFLTGLDCVPNASRVPKQSIATSSSGQDLVDVSGCDITTYNVTTSLNHIIESDDNIRHGTRYTDIPLRVHPYTFNVGGLNIGGGPTNDRGFIYINTLDTALYPNGVDENMSYNIQGTFRAVSYTGDEISNFVDQCYAADINMTLNHTYLTDVPTVPANTENLTYDLIDYNTSDPSIIIRTREQNTFANTLLKDITAPLSIQQNTQFFEKSMKGAITMDLGFNFDRTNDQELNPRRINFSDFNITYVTNPTGIRADMKSDLQIFGDRYPDQNITFLYARAKPGKEFYDDVSANNIDTPVSVVVYCNLGYTECQNRGIMALDAQTNEANWWKSWDHNNQTSQDGNIALVSTPASALNRTSASIISEGEDKTINVSRGSATLPAVIPVNLVVNDPANPPAPANYTDRWLIYNPESANLVSSPFYRVRFIGGSGWAGQGDTGHVVGGQSNVQKNRRMEW